MHDADMASTLPRVPVALPQETYDAIRAIANEEERSMSWILARAAKAWVKDHAADYQHLIMGQTTLTFDGDGKESQ
jgi:hypothetical protein